MDKLRDILATEITAYAGEMLNGYAYLTVSADRNIFTIVSVGKTKTGRFVHLSLLARVVDDHIVIETDDSNKPLADSLVQAGVPRDQIILAYAGEPVPESM